MDLKKNLGTNISMLFLLGLTTIVATVFHFANGATIVLSEGQSDITTELFDY